MHLAKYALNKAKYDITIQTIGIPLCTFSTLWYSEIRHEITVYVVAHHSIITLTLTEVGVEEN